MRVFHEITLYRDIASCTEMSTCVHKNSPCAETDIFWEKQVITVVTPTLTPFIARSSAAVALNLYDKRIPVFQKEWFQIPVPSLCRWRHDRKRKCVLSTQFRAMMLRHFLMAAEPIAYVRRQLFWSAVRCWLVIKHTQPTINNISIKYKTSLMQWGPCGNGIYLSLKT